jgi:hypothetical protein
MAPLKVLFATAFEDGLIRSNPAAGVRIIVKEAHAEREPRRSTPTKLRWQDVDLGTGNVGIARRFHDGDIDSPKSSYGVRRVRPTPYLSQALWPLRKDDRASDDGLVFKAEQGGRIDASNLMSRVFEARGRCGRPRRLDVLAEGRPDRRYLGSASTSSGTPAPRRCFATAGTPCRYSAASGTTKRASRWTPTFTGSRATLPNRSTCREGQRRGNTPTQTARSPVVLEALEMAGWREEPSQTEPGRKGLGQLRIRVRRFDSSRGHSREI